MKKIFLFVLFFLFFTQAFAESYTNGYPPLRIIEDFSSERLDRFPASFRTYPFQRSKAEQVYSVKKETDNSYLHGTDREDISVQVFKRFYWELEKWPHFSWKWRATLLPKNAAENKTETNDSACGVYVIFGGYTGKVLKYVWSSTLPLESVVEKEPGKFYILVLQSGGKKLGQWQTETINVREDFQRVFKAQPDKNPSGFGILTDGNATHSPASCDYDDFKISEKFPHS